MTDTDKQAAFLAALRKKAEEIAAKNPDPARDDRTKVMRALVEESRAKLEAGGTRALLGAYMKNDGSVSVFEPEFGDPARAVDEILKRLKARVLEGTIRAAGLSETLDKEIPTASGQMKKFIQLRIEDRTGKAMKFALPVNKPDLLAGVPGVNGPAVSFFGGPVDPMIFATQR